MSYYQKNALVQFRVDENVKREAEKYIKICGFDMPTAFKQEQEERESVENKAKE